MCWEKKDKCTVLNTDPVDWIREKLGKIDCRNDRDPFAERNVACGDRESPA